MPTKPTTLPIWATDTGSNVVTGLAIDNINWQTGTTSTVRYTFTGSPDLSAVIVGHQLVASSCTDDTHNGTFEITAVNNASDWIEVTNAAVTDATLDEASSPGTAIAKTGTALIQEPTSSKQTMGWLNSERPPAGYFNWFKRLVYDWLSWLDGWSTDIEADIAAIESEITGLSITTSVVTANTTAADKNHYFVNASERKKVTLPSVFSLGAKIRITGMGSGGWFIKPATGDSIFAPSTSVPTTGSAIFSDQQYTSVELVANAANSSWVIVDVSGAYTIRDPGSIVTTIAGNASGYSDGVGTVSQFNSPQGVALDSAGVLYIADANNNRIRKIDTAGTVTTVAGSTSGYSDGVGTAAKFNSPQGVALDSAGVLYIADTNNHRIRKIDTAGTVTTVAGNGSGYSDGVGTAVKFYFPTGVALSSAGNVYVVELINNTVRKIDTAGNVTTVAGNGSSGSADGTGTAATFNAPQGGIALDSAGVLYIADTNNHRIRKIDTAGAVTTIAGSASGYSDGVGTAAKFYHPYRLSLDSAGVLYIGDTEGHRIRKIDTAGTVTTITGDGTSGYSDGLVSVAKFYRPHDVRLDSAGVMYVADANNNRIRRIRAEDI